MVYKKKIELNPRAFYVPCETHSLNLVVNDATKASLEITNFDEIPTLLLKPVFSTRWESKIDTLFLDIS